MKEKGINNLKLKIISIFLAFFVWLVVVNVSNPEVVRSREVPLEILNEQVLTDAKRTYEINGKNTVTVYFDVRTRDEYKVRTTDFSAYIDLAELYDVTGSVQVKVDVLNNKEIIKNAEAKPGVVRVDTEELQTKSFDLAAVTEGKTADGYALNHITLAPNAITVKGPVSKVGLISYAGVEIKMNGISEDSAGITEPVFYDANGNKLEISNRIQLNTSEIQYQLSISKIKSLPLDFEVSGKVADGYRFTGVECATKSISVVGPKSSLASLNKVTVPAAELNLDGAIADCLFTVDLRKYLPEGVSIVGSESPEAEIRLKVEKLVTRDIVLSENDIRVEGLSENYNYRFLPSGIEVSVQGLQEDIETLSGEDLGAEMNLAGLEPGIHSGSLTFVESDVFKILSHSDFQVDISQKIGVLESPAATVGTDEENSGGTIEADSGTETETTAKETTEAEPADANTAKTGSVG